MSIFQDESDKMYSRFKKVSKDITDHYKKPLSKNGYTEDDNKAVEELIEKMEKLNELLEHYDNGCSQGESGTGASSGNGPSGGTGGSPKSFRDFWDSIFGTGR